MPQFSHLELSYWNSVRDAEYHGYELFQVIEIQGVTWYYMRKAVEEKITLTVLETIRDGGTLVCRGSDGRVYFIDNRIGTLTKGSVWDLHPGSIHATMLDSKKFTLPEL